MASKIIVPPTGLLISLPGFTTIQNFVPLKKHEKSYLNLKVQKIRPVKARFAQGLDSAVFRV
ncbi:MAG: hypothetical protein II196_02035, partial [Spirochaetales bacterium]|nr:hypothetical protein [Spirochaetales bacterium]